MNAQLDLSEPALSDFALSSASAVDPVPASAMPVFDSRLLLNGGREILIRHGDECYRLRHTRNDKLILTK